jgi:nucleotide-binding universal stress UspA family protein
MRSIVVPVNFTANAANAARYATDMALALGMDVHLVNVLEMSPASCNELSAGIHEELINSCLEFLQQLSEELNLRSHGLVRIATDLETGDIQRRLSGFCKPIAPFVIVCGSSEIPAGKILEGSTTINRIRHLPWPLLIVPKNASFHSIRNILIACDNEDIHNGIVNAKPLLETINQAFSPRYVALHVLVNDEAVTDRLSAEFQSWKNFPGTLNPAITFIKQPNVAMGIAEYLESHNADLLLILPKKHGWFDTRKSYSKNILSKIVPILSLNRKK